MPANHYNPWHDGLPAKAWECLRRNTAFKNNCENIWDVNEDDVAWNPNENHPFHLAAFVIASGFDPERPHDEPHSFTLFASRIADIPWRDLEEKQRTKLSEAIMGHTLDRFAVPEVPMINPIVAHPSYSEVESTAFFFKLDWYQATHELIAVPKFIRDPDHRNSIIAKFAEILGKPRAAKNYRSPRNSTLGTEADWDAYLLYKEWIAEDYPHGTACSLAAVERYEEPSIRQDFGVDPIKRKQEVKKRLAAPKGLTGIKYKTKIERQVKRIERAIKSVYPNFILFC